MNKPVNMIVACSENRVIGKDGGLPWSIPEDFNYFLDKTLGQISIMGRAAFEELDGLGEVTGKRTLVVVSRNKGLARPGVHVAASVQQAINLAQELEGEIWIGGGQGVYEEALPLTDRLYLTLVHAEVEGDRYFPEWRNLFTQVVSECPSSDSNYRYTFYVLEK